MGILSALLWVNNTSLFSQIDTDRQPKLIAHRGVHLTETSVERTNDTCRAQAIENFGHMFIENTIPSMEAAFSYGADIVEIDVHLTADNVFAVFHDWRLECQTNGVGVTHEQTFEYLRTIDIGYNFTSDGQSFPLRGSGVGLMPSLTEVLDADLDG